MTVYYNEIDPWAAQCLRNLIAAGHIAPGVVDERSIEDVQPNDLRGFTQCHFFAGIGVWSYALRRAGWADDRRVWTASCPCQPFSAAGKGDGFNDERHLWPAFYHLVVQHAPPTILGEQVASGHVDPWVDLVHADLEAMGYAFGGVPFPSAGVGAPHIRDRLYWVASATGERRGAGRPWSDRGLADTANIGLDGWGIGVAGDGGDAAWIEFERLRDAGGMDHTDHAGLEGQRGGHQAEGGRVGTLRPAAAPSESGGVGDANGSGLAQGATPRGGYSDQRHGHGDDCQLVRPGPTNGYWRDADWLSCRDGKWRPVEPGTSPLAHGAAARVGRLRAYGNAINAEAARVFIEAVMECAP